MKRLEIPEAVSLKIDIIDRLLAGNISLVAEAAFRYPLWAKGLGPLLSRAEMRVVQCRVNLDTLRERCIDRRALDPNRGFHPDGAFLAELERGQVVLGDWDMDALGSPCLTIDTSEGYRPRMEDIADFARWRDGVP